MISEEDRKYHVARARAELESSYRLSRPKTAEQHMQLSSLHLQKAHVLDDPLPELVARDLDWLREFALFHQRWLGARSFSCQDFGVVGVGPGSTSPDSRGRQNITAGSYQTWLQNPESRMLPVMKEAVPMGHGAYEEAVRDRVQGIARAQCPHGPGTEQAQAGLEGWDEEATEQGEAIGRRARAA